MRDRGAFYATLRYSTQLYATLINDLISSKVNNTTQAAMKAGFTLQVEYPDENVGKFYKILPQEYIVKILF
jgi:hypothetical protein